MLHEMSGNKFIEGIYEDGTDTTGEVNGLKVLALPSTLTILFLGVGEVKK